MIVFGSDPIYCDCLTDLNVDGETGFLDFVEVLAGWGECPPPRGDVDRDGVTNVRDFLALLAHWGACP